MNPKGTQPADSNITSGKNMSYWLADTNPLKFSKLRNNTVTDVLVIGGGISGLTTAYNLLKEGLKVVLIEDGFIGSGESGRTTAHITYALDDRYFQIEKTFGKHKAMLAANSHMTALYWIYNTIRHENINCNFRRIPGYLFLSSGDKFETLEQEYGATRRAGLMTEMIDKVPGVESLVETRGLKFPGQGQFHIMKYLKGLADSIVSNGGSIYTETKAEEITKEGATANGFTIKAKYIVVATNTPINDKLAIHTKQAAYRTYVIACKIRKSKLSYALWWDTGNPETQWAVSPYHYVRLEEYDDNYDLLIAGGEDHKTGQADSENVIEENRFNKLLDWTKRKFPEIENIEYKWSGQVMEPFDGMGYIGKNPGDDNIYIITGDSGNGMTHGTLGGILITDLIMGKKNLWEDLYDPSRKVLKATAEFLQETGNMAAQYTDWLMEGSIRTTLQLKPGQGGILSEGLKKVAVFCDMGNQLHAYTAVCPHLGGILHWNAEESSFDCPAHGSRFSSNGKVMNGPALNDLQKIQLKNEDKQH